MLLFSFQIKAAMAASGNSRKSATPPRPHLPAHYDCSPEVTPPPPPAPCLMLVSRRGSVEEPLPPR